ncbi:MAG: sodium:solute symporter family protein [Anaerovoracaceae bacterium]
MGDKISMVPFVILGIYLLIVLILAFAPQKKKAADSGSFEEFYTAGKSFGGIVVALIMLVTYYQGSTWTGWQGFVAQYGVFGAYVIPYCVGAGVVMYFLAEKVWPLGKKYSLCTMPDLLELRYQSIWLKVLSGFLGVAMDVTVITMEIVTLGYIINIATSGYVSITMGAGVGIAVLAIYILWGGIKSIGRVDSFNGFLMLIGSIFVSFFVAYFYYGGISEVFETVLKYEPSQFTLIGSEGYGTPQHWFSFGFICTVGALCWPSLYMKMYVGKGVNEIRYTGIVSAIAGIWCVFFLLTGFAAIGIEYIGHPGFEDPQSSLLLLVFRSGNMVVFGLLAVFILAATIGTVDSTLLADAGAFTNDVIIGFKRAIRKAPKIGTKEYSSSEEALDQKKVMLLTRGIIIAMAVLAFIVSQMNIPMLVFLVMMNYQGICLLFPPLIGGLYWKKSTAKGAIAGLICGIAVASSLVALNLEPLGFIPGVWALLVDTIVFVAVSLMTKNNTENEEVMNDIFGN